MNTPSLKSPKPIKSKPPIGAKKDSKPLENLPTSLEPLNLNMTTDQDASPTNDSSPTRISKVLSEPPHRKAINFDNQPVQIAENRRTPLHIEVEKGTKLFSDPARMYAMFSLPRGYALIINNQEFEDSHTYPLRVGAHVDSENLGSLFTQLGFIVVNCKDLRRRETLRKLDEIQEMAGVKRASMMVVCILSHGRDQGKIISTDGQSIDIEIDVLRKFNNDYCPELKGKPKFFIIQACRGDEYDYGYLEDSNGKSWYYKLKRLKIKVSDKVTTSTDANPTRSRRSSLPNQTFKELSWEDMLIAYSTLPGYVSNRDHYRGTWFIESICKVFMENAKDMNLRDMLDEVGMMLSKYESEIGTKQSFNYDVRHFYKKLYFNPGIEIDENDHWKHEASTEFDDIQSQENEDFNHKLIRKRSISVSGRPRRRK